MVKLADTPALGAGAARHGSSSLPPSTRSVVMGIGKLLCLRWRREALLRYFICNSELRNQGCRQTFCGALQRLASRAEEIGS